MEGGMWRGIERRTREALALEDPGERALALIALLRRADEDWTWDEDPDTGWDRRADAFSPVIEALGTAGPAAVDAILAGDAPPGSWYAGAAAMALDELHGRGTAATREQDALEWLMRNAADQDDPYMDAAISIVDRAGARSVPALTRFVATVKDAALAMGLSYALLEGSDPAWAAPAAEAMVRQLTEGGAGISRVLGPVTALFALRGPGASGAIRDLQGRSQRGPGDRDRRSDDTVKAMLTEMLAQVEQPEGEPDDEGVNPLRRWDDMFSAGAGPLPCTRGEEGCIPECPLADPLAGPEDIGAVPRYLLERACGAIGLEARGPKRDVIGRLWEHRERKLGLAMDPVPMDELKALSKRELRDLCENLDLDGGGTREELVGRLDRFFTEGSPEPEERFSERELDGMTLDELRTVCEDMGLPAKGKRAALVARVLGAQDGRRGR